MTGIKFKYVLMGYDYLLAANEDGVVIENLKA